MIKYHDSMTSAEIEALLAEEAKLDEMYADEARVAAIQDAKDAEELEVEADLWRYWRP